MSLEPILCYEERTFDTPSQKFRLFEEKPGSLVGIHGAKNFLKRIGEELAEISGMLRKCPKTGNFDSRLRYCNRLRLGTLRVQVAATLDPLRSRVRALTILQESESVDEPLWDWNEVLEASDDADATSAAPHSTTHFLDAGAYGEDIDTIHLNPSLFGFDAPASNAPTFGDLNEFDFSFLHSFPSNGAAPRAGVAPASTTYHPFPALPAATYEQGPHNTYFNPRLCGFEPPPALCGPTFDDLGEFNFSFLHPFPSNNADLATQVPRFALASDDLDIDYSFLREPASAVLSRLPSSPPSTSLLCPPLVPMSSPPVGDRDQEVSRKR
ncbi:hypothetical protein DFH09DRAFT_1093540 [Mycena vulgaris]|nr:hypothetical protein DFH09DRAFT_1093540 [Mycena vulgaris]